MTIFSLLSLVPPNISYYFRFFVQVANFSKITRVRPGIPESKLLGIVGAKLYRTDGLPDS